MNQAKYIVISLVAVIFSQVGFATGEPIGQGLGDVNDILVDGSNVYFFEVDKSITSPAFIPDTRIMMYDGQKISRLSDDLFMYPTELHTNGDYIYFAILANDCMSQMLCDYQDIIKMSKKDGSKNTLTKDLKSAVHISTGNEALYISESNGNIWKVGYDDDLKKIIFKTDNIIMDIASDYDTIYWIEEIEDQNNRIMSVPKGSSNAKIIDSDLKIPYDLKMVDNTLYWNEIYVKGIDELAEFTKIITYKDGKTRMLMEFKNTSPISKIQSTPHYGPYLVAGDYIFAVNNTEGQSAIHMQNMKNETIYDIDTRDNYDVKFLRAEEDSLYAVGINSDGFVLERYDLPITVPEFSSLLFLTVIIGLSLTILLMKFSHYQTRLKI